MARIDFDRAASTYDEGRALPLEMFGEWRVLLGELLPTDLTGPVLDLGAGTGIWTDALATWFELPVVGVEPSVGMRRKAANRPIPADAFMVAGDAQAIPLRNGSCRAAWLSTVIHHIPDLPAGAGELRRVLTPGGVVFIRSSFPGRHDEIPLFRFFPGAMTIASTFPTVDATVVAFEGAGFHQEALLRVHESRDASLMDMVDRVRAMRHSDSTLVPLSDEEFEVCMASLKRAAATGLSAPPIGLDLLVLR